MTLEIKQSTVLTDEESKRLFDWGENIFGVAAHQLRWRPKDVHFVLYCDGQPVSHVGILQRAVSVGGHPVTVAGIGGVVTVPEAQRKGFALRLMKHATTFVESEWQVDAGLLFCLPALVAYYEFLGWQVLESQVLIEQPGGPIASPLRVMVLPLGEKLWPAGNVELQSLPW